MARNNFHALVIDDESHVRNLTIRALLAEGFTCDAAADGLQAKEMIDSTRYDVVVTDLRMPNRHGYSLATELLAMEDRPAIVVLTGVLEPKLAADLIARGVDHFEFKPVRYDRFAAMVKVLVNQREMSIQGRNGAGLKSPRFAVDRWTAPVDREPLGRSGPGSAVLDVKLPLRFRISPVSQAAFEVFNMTRSDAFDIRQTAAAITRDSSLSDVVLKLANSAFFNPSGRKTVDLNEAIVRIGQKQIGKLALTAKYWLF